MGHFRTTRILIALTVGTAIFLGTGLGHTLGANQSSSGVSDSKNHCHASCILDTKEQQKKLIFQDDDIDPDPLLYVDFKLASIATIYAVIISALALLFLRRRPPDILAKYCYWLN